MVVFNQLHGKRIVLKREVCSINLKASPHSTQIRHTVCCMNVTNNCIFIRKKECKCLANYNSEVYNENRNTISIVLDSLQIHRRHSFVILMSIFGVPAKSYNLLIFQLKINE